MLPLLRIARAALVCEPHPQHRGQRGIDRLPTVGFVRREPLQIDQKMQQSIVDQDMSVK